MIKSSLSRFWAVETDRHVNARAHARCYSGILRCRHGRSLWPVALSEVAGLTNSQAASFWVLDGSVGPRLPTFISFNFDLKIIDEYLKRLAPIDPTNQYLIAHPQQPIVHDGLVITEQQKDKHPYYDWHDRNIDTRFRMVGQTRLMPHLQAGVALHRTRKAGRYEPRDIDRFAVLQGHLARAVTIASRLGSLGTARQLTADWLDRNEAAVVFLDEHKRIVFANRSAQNLFSNGDGVTGGVNGVALSRKQENDKFQALIVQALPPLSSAGTFASGTMRARRPSEKRPYGIFVSPLSRRYPILSAFRPAVCVVITDPDGTKTTACRTIAGQLRFYRWPSRTGVPISRRSRSQDRSRQVGNHIRSSANSSDPDFRKPKHGVRES